MRAEIVARRTTTCSSRPRSARRAATGSSRNKQTVTRRRDLAGQLRVTVFAPDDLALVKGGPAGRRDFLDDLLVASTPRLAGVITDYERVVQATQRAAARAASATRRTARRSTCSTSGSSRRGAELVDAAARAVERLTPAVRDAYASLAGDAPGFATAVRGRVERREPLDRGAVDDVDARRARARVAAPRGATAASRSSVRTATTGVRARRHGRAAPRVAGRAAHARARRCGSPATGSSPTSSAPSRSCCSTTSSASSTRSAAAALVAHLPATQTLVTTAGRAARGHRGRGVAARIEERPGRWLTETACRWATRCRAVARVSSACRRPSVLRAGRAAWPEVVGAALAAHSASAHLRAACARSTSTTGVGRPVPLPRRHARTALAERVPEAAIREISVTGGARPTGRAAPGPPTSGRTGVTDPPETGP